MHTYNYCGFNFESLSTNTEKSQTIMREPHDNDIIGNSTSSDLSNESSTYCDITSPQKPVLRDSLLSNETSSSGYADFFEIRDGHQVWSDTQVVNKQGKINKGFTSDRGSSNDMEPPNESLTEREQCPGNHRSDIIAFPSIIPIRRDYPIHRRSPPPEIHPPTTIQPPDEGNKRPDTNINDWPYPFGPLPGYSKRLDSNINWRRIKPVVLVVFICLSVSAVVALIVINKNVDDPVPTPFPPEFLTDKCNNQESVVSPGDRICIPYDDLHNTSRISHITIQQTSSTYSYTFFQYNMSVNSTVSNFTRHVDDWIVDYDISRIDQMLRLVQPKSYCSSTGKYIVILEYTDGSHTSFEFEVRMKDPQLNQSITFDDQGIHVHCELRGTCLPSSLAIYVTVNNSTVLVPGTNACSYTDKKTGTMVSIQATIPSSMFTKNQRISCVPLMRNQELVENLTNTIPICHGPECKPNCQDDSATNMYFPDSVYCDKYYQCANGEAIEKPCPIPTYWEPMNCTCAHDTTAICDINTHKRITPLRTLNPCA